MESTGTWHELFANAAHQLGITVFALDPQPHQLDLALRLLFQAPAGPDTIEISVDAKLQEHRGVIYRVPVAAGPSFFKTEFAQIRFVDKDFGCANRIGFLCEFVKRLGQQCALRPVSALLSPSLDGWFAFRRNCIFGYRPTSSLSRGDRTEAGSCCFLKPLEQGKIGNSGLERFRHCNIIELLK